MCYLDAYVLVDQACIALSHMRHQKDLTEENIIWLDQINWITHF